MSIPFLLPSLQKKNITGTMPKPDIPKIDAQSLISHAQPTLGTLPEWFVLGGAVLVAEEKAGLFVGPYSGSTDRNATSHS